MQVNNGIKLGKQTYLASFETNPKQEYLYWRNFLNYILPTVVLNSVLVHDGVTVYITKNNLNNKKANTVLQSPYS